MIKLKQSQMAKQDSDLYFKLGEMHADIKNTYDEAKKTNGRVTKLETETIPNLSQRLSDEVNGVKLKVAYYTGGFAVVIWILEKVISKYI
jgi:hypothetical protein